MQLLNPMPKLAVLLALLAFPMSSIAQVMVSTVTDEFDASGGVKLGPDGLVYIGNYGAALPNANGTQIWRYNPVTDTLGVWATGLNGASGNAFDSQGNFYQSNIAGNSISKVTPQGVVSTFVSSGIASPVGIAVDANDNLFVCNCGNNTIQRVTPQGSSTTFSSDPLLSCPNGITMDAAGNLYVSNFNNGSVLKLDQAGNTSLLAVIPGGNNGHLTYSAADSLLYVASHGSSTIYRLTLDGIFLLLAGNGTRGNTDGPADVATFSRPNGVAASATGDTLYINSSIPTTDVGLPLNPSVLRMITGVLLPNNTSASLPQEPLYDVRVAPNPSFELLTIHFTLEAPELVEYTLHALDGSLALQSHQHCSAGKNVVREHLSGGFSDGLYLLTVHAGKHRAYRMVAVHK